ncbi:MAG: dicarboxylate/amino acid:cation symporter [Muribaculaceae bacterium]|nr:dicarboxylate/amino acid:cation symporter [Muribaculaceae bacterium]
MISKKPNLLVLIILAILSGVLCGNFVNEGIARSFITFNSIFSNFLGFCIPLIIIGFVTPAISDLGKGAGKMLLVTVLLAYGVTLGAGFLSYFVGDTFFTQFIDYVPDSGLSDDKSSLNPYFTINISPVIDIMSALVLSFILGIGITQVSSSQGMLKKIAIEFKEIISWIISKIIVPLLPLYIFGMFLKMSFTGEANVILSTFYKVILVIFVLHLAWLIILYTIGALFSRKVKNPLKLIWKMLPAYFTALGTSSSAATIPVTLKQTIKMGVNEDIAGFTVPLCATINLSGSALKIVSCALALMVMEGMTYDFGTFAYFIVMMGVALVAAPGVPGGSIMAALGLLTSILGFSDSNCALMIALYIAMDSFGTACNVTGDGAIALIIDRFFGNKNSEEKPQTLEFA